MHWAWIVLESCLITFFVNYSIRIGAYPVVSPVLTGYLADVTGSFRWSFGLGAVAVLITALCIGLIRGREVSGKEGD